MSSIGYRRHQAALAAKRARDGFEARFPGICRRCDVPIKPGDPIARVPGGGFIHTTCASGQDEE